METESHSNIGIVSPKTYQLLHQDSTPAQQSCASLSCLFTIDPHSNLHSQGISSPSRLLLSQNIVQVSCNNSIAAFISSSGKIFTFGEDKEKFGLLGIKNCFSLIKPRELNIDTKAANVHVGFTHVALLSSSGELYTWGSGVYGELGGNLFCERQTPTMVKSAQIFLIKQVVCGRGFTAFCTAGGLLYVYGQLMASLCGLQKKKSPYTIAQLGKSFIVQVEASKDFLVAVSDCKEVFLVDGCLETFRLPEKYSRVACCDEYLLLVTKKDKLMHEVRASPRAVCKASYVSEKVFLLEELFSDKITLFSGIQISYHLTSFKSSKSDLSLQYLRQNHFRPQIAYKTKKNPQKPILSSLISILSCKFTNTVKSSFNCLKFKAKYESMKEKTTLSLVLQSIITNMLMRIFVLKKNGFKSFWARAEQEKKRRKSKEFKKSFTIHRILNERIKKVFNLVVNIFQNTESRKIAKIRLTEKIVSRFLMKTSNDLNFSFGLIKYKTQTFTKMSKNFGRLFELIEKSLKFNFIQSLVQVNIIKVKLRNIVNQILAFSAAKSSRTQIFKHFHEWKRQIIASKIAAISQKYSRSIKTKKITEKIKQLLRNSLKLGLFSLKLHSRTPFNKLKLSFFLKTFEVFFHFPKKQTFSLIKSFSKINKRIINLAKNLIKTRFKQINSSIIEFIKAKRLILLMKILSSHETKIFNMHYNKKHKVFSILKIPESRSLSPALSTYSDSIGAISSKILQNMSLASEGQNSLKLNNQSKNPFLQKSPREEKSPPVKAIDFSRLKTGNPTTLEAFLNKFGKNKRNDRKTMTAKTPSFKRKIKKTMTLSSRERVNLPDCSDFSPRSEGIGKNVDKRLKELSPWEIQLMGLAQSLIAGVYRSRARAAFNMMTTGN